MNIERMMLVEAVLNEKVSADVLTQKDLDDYQYAIDLRSFIFSIAEAYERNPSMTFSEVDMGMVN